MREWLEYAAAWTGLKLMGLLPRSAARWVGAGFAWMAYRLRPPLRRAARAHLQIAFPEWSEQKRDQELRRMIQQVAWLAGEFSQLPKYSRANIEQIVVIDGFENFDAAKRLGQGVLFLTGHMSAWELSSFAHALYGYPLHFLVRAGHFESFGRCRHGRDPDGPQHVSGRRCFCEFLRRSGVGQFRPCAPGVTHRRGGGAGIFDLGYLAPEIPAQVRKSRGARPHRQRRSGRDRKHSAFHPGH